MQLYDAFVSQLRVTMQHCHNDKIEKLTSLEMLEMSKTYRVKTEYVSLIQKTHIDFIVKTRLPIDEADIVNALIAKYLKDLKPEDVIEWQKEYEKK
ncbi:MULTISPECIES: hypothetical protein [Acinetobacter calcoaceticus/baumannii complex]|uniref:hypothetical protein n=1 Tax=Acinetobacter calcoaceticus/baumannii complex TaxID=909768 RepID=UPI000994877E|nr:MULTISPECIES: hypothetical protein [Acinetobacter calcoaceticus/baumannii complex]